MSLERLKVMIWEVLNVVIKNKKYHKYVLEIL